MSSTSGSTARALAMQRRCCWPPESPNAVSAAMAAQNTSYACVEKNIRSMVGKLQAGACGEYQALMGGLPAERPSNELFLRRLARRILEW